MFARITFSIPLLRLSKNPCGVGHFGWLLFDHITFQLQPERLKSFAETCSHQAPFCRRSKVTMVTVIIIASATTRKMAGLRSSGYTLGVVLLLLGSLFYVIGYAFPYWTLDENRVSMYSGLWFACESDSHGVARPGASGTQCTFHGHAVTFGLGWFKAVQALQSIGLIGVVVSCVYSVATICCQSMPSYTRFLEMFAGGSGVVGFVSVMIYVGKTAKYFSDYYSWAFGLDLAGCIIVIIAACIIAGNNNRDNNASTAPPVYYTAEPAQGGNTVVVQSYGPGPYQPPGGVAGYPQAYAMPPQYPPGIPPLYPAGMPPPYPSAPPYPAGMPPPYPSAPPQEYGWGAPPPPEGYSAQFQGYGGYNYPHGYSRAPEYPQAPPLE